MDDAAALFPRIAAAPVLSTDPAYLTPGAGKVAVHAADGRILYRNAAPIPQDQRTQRYRGSKGVQWSRDYLTRFPLCASCWAKHGRIKASRCVDHIVDLEYGGDHDERNLQPLCRECNDDKKLETRGLDNVRSIRSAHAAVWEQDERHPLRRLGGR